MFQKHWNLQPINKDPKEPKVSNSEPITATKQKKDSGSYNGSKKMKRTKLEKEK